jgi:PHD/YefM family antitoxin component YafN of YafNO toxin-antitoxin module
MSVMAVQEIKRRGISAVDDALEEGPVHLIKSNKAKYVIMYESSYRELMSDLTDARLAASDLDIKAGRFRTGVSADLMRELTAD